MRLIKGLTQQETQYMTTLIICQSEKIISKFQFNCPFCHIESPVIIDIDYSEPNWYSHYYRVQRINLIFPTLTR